MQALKVINWDISFLEIPNEITLCFNISNCPIKCPDCHSKFLWNDTGEVLTRDLISILINKNEGITCICFMGGDLSPSYINILAKHIKKTSSLKVGWYSGSSIISDKIDPKWFDFIKIGPYIKELGGLDSPTTNQKMFKIEHEKDKYKFINITTSFIELW
jgi:anaerobic ribonucleoside-triphosphate reductase activating protein